MRASIITLDNCYLPPAQLLTGLDKQKKLPTVFASSEI